MASFDYDVRDHRLRVRRQRRRAPCRGEGLPGRRHGVRQALERRRHPEEPVASARVPVVPGGRALRDPAGRVPRRRAGPLRRRRRWRIARLRQHACTSRRSSSSTPRSGRASPTGPTSWRPSRPGDADARCRPLPVHADRRRSRHAAGRDRDGTRRDVQQGARRRVYFGQPGVEADDPYFGGVGPRRTGCISCGKCNIGCGHNAKNKLTTNYLYLAEKLGAEVHELHEVLRPRARSTEADSRCTPGIRAGRSEPRICTITPTPPSR